MRDILDEIVAYKRLEVSAQKELHPAQELYRKVECIVDKPVPDMQGALLKSATGIIAEFKRKSPSKGWIKEEGKAAEIPIGYQQAGASAVSILTDEHFFGGADDFIGEARDSGLTLPVLYKNFIVDEYQLFKARLSGASAVLLIAAVLSRKECAQLLKLSHELGMQVLLEIHAERELDYADLPTDMLGVNNRNLGVFKTDVQNSFFLADKLPSNLCKVSESGINNVQIVKDLRNIGYSGFLMGEAFMQAPDPGVALADFLKEF